MEILVFNKWSAKEAAVTDEGLKRYITLEPTYRTKTGARYGSKRFYKSKVFIIERLINKLMVPGHRARKHKMSSGHITGKSSGARKIVHTAFSLVEQRTKKNPFTVFVTALENCAPREEIITIEYGGARYPKAVDSAPQRRVDVALRYLIHGSFDKAFNKKKNISEALADEIINSYALNSESLGVSKKNETERQADSSR